MGDNSIKTPRPNSISKEYVNLLRSEVLEVFHPFIFQATRVTESSQICIDHVYSNFSIPSKSVSISL